MSSININARSLPNRCEICHQSDCFDPANNYCSRCAANNVLPPTSEPMPNNKLNVYFELLYTDISDAQWEAINGNWFSWIVFAVLTVMPVYILVLTLINWSNLTLGSFMSLLPGLIFMLVIPLSIYFSRRKAKAATKEKPETVRISFAFDGYDISTGKDFSHTSWDRLVKVVESNKFFFLYHINNVYNLVPKRAFTNTTDIEMLREIVKKNLDKKAVLFSDPLHFYQRPKFGIKLYLSLVIIGLIFTSYHGHKLYGAIVIEDLAKQARAAVIKNNFADAKEKYQQLITLQPNVANHYEMLGECLFQEKKWNEATEAFQKALQLSPNTSWTLYWLALTAIELKDYKSAVNYYQQVLYMDPDNASLHYQLGYLFNLLGERPKTIERFQKVIELSPNSSYSRIAQNFIDGKIEKLVSADDIDEEK